MIIFTDSRSAIEGIRSNDTNVYKNMYINEVRRYFKWRRETNKKIVIVWISGHEGIEGNEMADKLTKSGTEKESTRELKVPFFLFKGRI